MSQWSATNAASSGIVMDNKALKRLMRHSDAPGLRYLALWLLMLLGSGTLVHLALDSWALVPALVLYGTILTVPSYSLSHECAHGTAFRTRWLNETVFFISSLLYLEPPTFRRYAHAGHHTYTWIRGKDTQMPFATPLTLGGWLLELSGLEQYRYDLRHMIRNAVKAFDADVRGFTPASELDKLAWESRAFLAVYAALAGLALAFDLAWMLVLFLVIPRLIGGVTMQLFTNIQHAEMQEDQPDIRKSTRSFTTNRFARFLYMNMSWHVEHHLYPTVPFHALPSLNQALRGQLPEPDRGLFRANAKVLRSVLQRRAQRAAPMARRGEARG